MATFIPPRILHAVREALRRSLGDKLTSDELLQAAIAVALAVLMEVKDLVKEKIA